MTIYCVILFLCFCLPPIVVGDQQQQVYDHTSSQVNSLTLRIKPSTTLFHVRDVWLSDPRSNLIIVPEDATTALLAEGLHILIENCSARDRLYIGATQKGLGAQGFHLRGGRITVRGGSSAGTFVIGMAAGFKYNVTIVDSSIVVQGNNFIYPLFFVGEERNTELSVLISRTNILVSDNFFQREEVSGLILFGKGGQYATTRLVIADRSNVTIRNNILTTAPRYIPLVALYFCQGRGPEALLLCDVRGSSNVEISSNSVGSGVLFLGIADLGGAMKLRVTSNSLVNMTNNSVGSSGLLALGRIQRSAVLLGIDVQDSRIVLAENRAAKLALGNADSSQVGRMNLVFRGTTGEASSSSSALQLLRNDIRTTYFYCFVEAPAKIGTEISYSLPSASSSSLAGLEFSRPLANSKDDDSDGWWSPPSIPEQSLVPICTGSSAKTIEPSPIPSRPATGFDGEDGDQDTADGVTPGTISRSETESQWELIVGIVAGCVLLVFVLGLVTFCIFRHPKRLNCTPQPSVPVVGTVVLREQNVAHQRVQPGRLAMYNSDQRPVDPEFDSEEGQMGCQPRVKVLRSLPPVGSLQSTFRDLLEKEGLAQYIPMLEREQILTVEDLALLNAEDLQDIGVDVLIHRKKLCRLTQNESSFEL